MNKKLFKVVLFAAMTIGGLSACGKKEEPAHVHDYVSVPEVAATCETDGMKAYYTCSGCELIFDADKNETTKDNLVIPKLGHQFALNVSGDYKTSYIVGETFDTTNLVVKKVCTRSGCTKEEVADYCIVYQRDGANCVGLGDTKVTVVAGDLNKDLAITVDKKDNAINGLKASYDIHCKEGISLDDVTSLSGDPVSISYYSDADFEDEITVDDLIGDNTYYALVESDGTNEEYDLAKASTVINVTHESGEVDSKTVIGYKEYACTHCGEFISKSENKMTTVDALFEADEEGGLKEAYFQSNAMGKVSDTAEGNRGITGGIMWYSESENVEVIEAVLPAVNFSLYQNVYMMWGTSSKSSWGNNSVVSFGVNNEEELLPIDSRPDDIYGYFIFEYVADESTLYLNNSACDGSGYYVEITNEDIINGEASLTLSLRIGNYRSFYLNKVVMDHLEHTPGETSVCPTTNIGYKNILCDVCGDVCKQSEDIMQTSDIDLNNTYGAMIYNKASQTITSAVAKDGKIIYVFGQDSEGVDSLGVPKINYTLYDNVKIDFTIASGWFTFGVTENNSLSVRNHETATLQVYRLADDDGYRAFLTLNNDGDGQDNVPVTFTNKLGKAVYTGESQMGLYTKSQNADRTVYITGITLNNSHEHVEQTSYDTSRIGKKYIECDLCSEFREATVTSADVDYDGSIYYAYCQELGADRKTTAAVDGRIQYSTESASFYKKHQIGLPRIDFARFNEISFEIESNCYYGVDLTPCWKDGETKDATCGNAILTLKFTNISETSVDVSLLVGETVISAKQITDENVIKGSDSFLLYAGVSEAEIMMYVSTPELAFDAGEHDHDWKVTFGSKIGTIHEACSICGATKEDSERTCTTNDVSYGTRKFGARFHSIDWSGVVGGDIKVNNSDKELYYGTTQQYVRHQAYMPRVDFKLYSEVSFDIQSNCHYGLGFESAWKDGAAADATCGQRNVTLKIVNNGENNLTTELIVDGNTVVSATCTDSNVYAGNEGLLVWCGVSEATTPLVVGLPTLTLK